MSLNRKVNLEVKYNAGSSDSDYKVKFKFTSYETSAVPLTEYRIVGYAYIPQAETTVVYQDNGDQYNSTLYTTGTLSYQNATLTLLDDVSAAPRIFPEDERYNLQWDWQYPGTIEITAAGGYVEGTQISYKTTDNQKFTVAGDNNIFVGVDAISRSYSFTSATSYENNSTYILEWNDDGVWKKVSEVTATDGSADQNTGEYPYETKWSDQGGTNGDYRDYGWLPELNDHTIINVSGDTYIDAADSSSNFSTVSTVTLNPNGNTEGRWALYKFDLSTITSAVSAAELFTYIDDAEQDLSYSCAPLLSSLESDTANWVNTNTYIDYDNPMHSISLSVAGSNNHSKGWLNWKIPTTSAQNWVDNPGTNTGMSILHTDQTITESNNPTIYFSETTTNFKKPRLIIVQEVSAAVVTEDRSIWVGSASDAWDNDNNWLRLTKPGTDEYALFDENFSTATCVLSSNEHIAGISATDNYPGIVNLSAALIIDDSADFSNFSNLILVNSTVGLADGCILSLSANVLNDLSISGTITTNGNVRSGGVSGTITATSASSLVIDDIFECQSVFTIPSVAGDGTLYIISATPNYDVDWNVDVVYERGAVELLGGLYRKNLTVNFGGIEPLWKNPTTITIGTSGNLNVEGNFTLNKLVSSAATIEWNTSTYNPVINVSGDFVVSGDDCVKFSLGTGDYNFKGSNFTFYHSVSANSISAIDNVGGSKWNLIPISSMNVNPDYNTFYPELVVSGGLININSDLNTSGLEVIQSGMLSLQNKTLNILNDFIVNGGSNTFVNINGTTFNVSGNALLKGTTIGNLDIVSISENQFDVDGYLNADYVDIKSSNAIGVKGYASNSNDQGGNVNWYFDAVEPTITLNTTSISLTSNTTITIPGSASSDRGLTFSSVGLSAGSVGTIANLTSASEILTTFNVVISATSDGFVGVSALDYGLRTGTGLTGRVIFDTEEPIIIIGTSIPSIAESNSDIIVPITVTDNKAITISNIPTVDVNGEMLNVYNLNQDSATQISFTTLLTSEVYSGVLSISASDSAGNIATCADTQLYNIDKTAPSITFISSSPSNKKGESVNTYVRIIDNYKSSTQSSSYSAFVGGVSQSIVDIHEITSATTDIKIEVTKQGTLTVYAADQMGNVSTCADYNYIIGRAPILFGNPDPKKINTGTITIPVSAFDQCTSDINNYYARINEQQLSITNLTNFDDGSYSFTVTITGNDISGDLVVSAGYTDIATIPPTELELLGDAQYTTRGTNKLGDYVYTHATSGSANSVVIFDVSDLSDPAMISTTYIDEIRGFAFQNLYNDRYLVYVSVDNNSITLVDVLDPFSPVSAGTAVITSGDETQNFDIEGDYAYVPLQKGHGLATVDISDPSNPTVTDVYVNDSLGDTKDVAVKNGIAYVAHQTGFCILDVSNPLDIVYINNVVDSDNSTDIHCDNNNKYIYKISIPGILRIYDVSDPNNIILLSSFTGKSIGRGTKSGEFLYLPEYSNNSFSVVDISDPYDPVVTTRYDFLEFALPTTCTVSEGYVYVTGAGQHKLYIFKFD